MLDDESNVETWSNLTHNLVVDDQCLHSMMHSHNLLTGLVALEGLFEITTQQYTGDFVDSIPRFLLARAVIDCSKKYSW